MTDTPNRSTATTARRPDCVTATLCHIMPHIFLIRLITLYCVGRLYPGGCFRFKAVRFTGENFRKAHAQAKMERLKTLLNRKESL